MVVELIVGLSIVTSVPPVNAVYHFIVPELAVADNVTVPEPQTDAGVTEADATVGKTFTAIVIPPDSTGLPVAQTASEVISTVIILPLARVDDVYKALLVP